VSTRTLLTALAFGTCMLALVASTAACAKHPTKPTWSTVWRDEFDGPVGQLPDSARWAFDVGTDWGNNQLEYDTNRAENVSLDGDGHLAITAWRENYLGREYTSGRINTNGRFTQREGRFEARMKMPTGRGLWPAFWLLGANFSTAGWPGCGELDILEYRGQEPTLVHGSLHGPGYSGGSAWTRVYGATTRLDSTWHVYAVEWSAAKITWFVDDVAYASATPKDVHGTWVFDHPFFVILDLAVGGGFVGAPDAGTTFPQRLLVDWVRVSRRD
jgi:beta-glucanase (GH16 family)